MRWSWTCVSLLAAGGLGVATVASSVVPVIAQTRGPARAPSIAAAAASHRAMLTSHCVTCHNTKLHTAGLALDAPEMSDVALRPEVWEKVVQKVRMGAMPPSGARRPEKAAVDAFLAWLEDELDRAAAAHPNPGRTASVHRLNRSEYRSAVRDLLGLDVDVDSLLPADDADKNGFDNVAANLSVSPALLDRYLSAARRLSRLALGIPPVGPLTDTYKAPILLDQNGPVSEDLPFGSRGGLAIRHYFPVDGEYRISVRLRRQLYDYIVGLGAPHRLEARIDGALVLATTVGGTRGTPPPASFVGEVFGDAEWEHYALTADAGLEARFRAKAGLRTLGVAFISRRAEVEDGVTPPKGAGRQEERDEMLEGNPAIDSVSIDGPHVVDGPGDTPSRRAILVCAPRVAAEEAGCARRILSSIARRAYRRPVTDGEVAVLIRFFDEGRKGGSFDSALQFGIERILADPNFFFRVEREPLKIAPGTPYRLSDLELASRLSFFLWSSVPDEELLEAASHGRLKDPVVLDRQVKRMLASPVARTALTRNFAAQWLQLRQLRNMSPSDEFQEFDENLRQAFEQETMLLVEHTLREDSSVLDLISANYTFVNERLARHYRIPNVRGQRFRRVVLEDNEQRGGLLGHGSILTVTSYPNRTSPVLRGKWLLENILGTPPPPPPPDVPGLPDQGPGGAKASVRERLERHRRNPTCAACHAPMDPLGFALEHYDAVGAWRTTAEGGAAVDASGRLPDGATVEGLNGLRSLLMSRPEQFAGTVTEKLLSYALGRGLEYHDMPVVRRIVRDSASSDYRWSSLITGIVNSASFQMRMSRGDSPRSAVAAHEP
jgi:mono/diheme cytochrome c family protein